MNIPSLVVTIGGLAVIACAHGSGTRPNDMSAPKHESAAKQEDAESAKHTTQYDPDSESVWVNCELTDSDSFGAPVCFRDRINPTEEHLARAALHRDIAAKHRAASEALLRAEEATCSGIAPEDRDMSPFAHAGDIRAVNSLNGVVRTGKVQRKKLVGATVILNPVRGLNREWLQRVVDCHLARNAVIETSPEDSEYCPLAIRGATATVRSLRDGFAIDIKSDDAAQARLILSKAEALRPR